MKHLRNFKFMALAMFVAMLSLSFTACSDDDDDESADPLGDYYVEVAVHDNGKMPPAEAASFARMLNTWFEEKMETEYFIGARESEAKYAFNKLLNAFLKIFNDDEFGDFMADNIAFKASLKAENGGTVASKIIKFSKEGCTLE